MTRAVLWDMDGTLIDSEEFHWLAWRDAMEAEGRPITHEEFLETFGWRNDAILPHFFGGRATPEAILRIGDAKEEHYRRLVRQHGLTPLPGAAEWLTRLKGEGWKQTIGTSAPRANADVIVDVLNWGGLLDGIVAAEDVKRGKPEPDVFLAAAAKAGAEPARCIVVEDAIAGVEAGRRAGMKTIGVGKKFRQLHADVTVAALDQLAAHCFEELLP